MIFFWASCQLCQRHWLDELAKGIAQEGYTMMESWNNVGLDRLIDWHGRLEPGKTREAVSKAIGRLCEHKDGEP